jgi:hypothetical protein
MHAYIGRLPFALNMLSGNQNNKFVTSNWDQMSGIFCTDITVADNRISDKGIFAFCLEKLSHFTCFRALRKQRLLKATSFSTSLFSWL